MRILTFLTLIAISHVAFSQAPIISASEFNTPANTWGYTLCDYSTFTPGAAGSNVTWDFSALSTIASPATLTYFNPATTYTPDQDSFPSANQYVENEPFVNVATAFYELSSSSFTIDGYMTTSIARYYDTEDFLRFPCTYNSTFTDSFHAVLEMTGAPHSFIRTGNVTSTADGYGTLILPNGTFNNVLRVKTYETYTDDYTPTPTSNASTYYTWYGAGIIGPLLKYDSVYNGSNYSKTLAYESTILPNGIADHSALSALKVYPNPADHMITVSVPSAQGSYMITDLSGQMVVAGDIKGQYTIADISTLAKGLYLVQVKSDGATATEKLTVN